LLLPPKALLYSWHSTLIAVAITLAAIALALFVTR
jgi:hypothetical protein